MTAAATLSDPMLRHPDETSLSSHYLFRYKDGEDPAHLFSQPDHVVGKTQRFSQEYSLAYELLLLVSPEAEVSPGFFIVLISLVPSAAETPTLAGIRNGNEILHSLSHCGI